MWLNQVMSICSAIAMLNLIQPLQYKSGLYRVTGRFKAFKS